MGMPMEKVVNGEITDEDVMVVVGDKLFFTDPPFGLLRRPTLDFGTIYDAAPQGGFNVFCVDLSSETFEMESVLYFPAGEDVIPNGIGFYGEMMVLGITAPSAAVRVYNSEYDMLAHWELSDLYESGAASGPADETLPVFCDGLTVEGSNAFASCSGGVYVFDIEAMEYVSQVYINDLCSNNFIADGYLYMTANSNLLRVALAEEEEPTDCTDCVSQDDYERLYRMVEAQAEQIAALESQMMDVAGLEATVNDVDTQLTNLATCLSYDSSYEPEPEPETMEPTKSPTSLLNVLSIGVVCPSEGGYRTFKNKDHETPESCYYACEAHERCEYFSYRESNFDCIGCSIVPNTSNGFTEEYVTYAVNMGSRRQLSELELLRAENAALKEALSQARRN